MREAEQHSTRTAAAPAGADAEERHCRWVSEAECSRWDKTGVLKSELSMALSQTRALPGQPCQG